MVTKSKRVFGALAGFALMLVSCTTPEYQAANGACRIELTQKIPPRYHTERYEGVRLAEVPTGHVMCRRIQGQLYCQRGTHLIDVPYVEYRTVDDMAAQRDDQIDQCTKERCAAEYGNLECRKA